MPLSSLLKNPGKKTRLVGAGVIAVAAASAILLFAFDTGPQKQVQGPGGKSAYAGSQSCKACHEEVYNGWRTTFHAAKFRPAEPDFVIGDFSAKTALPPEGEVKAVARRGDAFLMTTQVADGNPEIHKIRYALGSIWKQLYVTEFPDGAMHVLPLQWNVATLQWAGAHFPETPLPGEGAKKGPGPSWREPGQAFQFQCMGCHTTNAEVNFDPATGRFATWWGEPGVGCEACHGPGGAHIAAKIPDKAATILNPARLPDPRRAAMICGSCHTRGRTPDGKYAYPVAYQPGGQLNFLFDETPGVYPDGNPKAHHQQYNDWKASGHEAAGVMCWDCHSPHIRGKSNRFQLKLPGSLLCRTCHEVHPQGVHGLHSVNNCIGCHMPSTVKSATAGDLRSHRFIVSRPQPEAEEPQPNSCNLCHYHAETDPERLTHYLKAVQKPGRCKACHYHAEQDPEDEE